MMEYRNLTPEDMKPGLLDGFQRRQEVMRCWRKVDGLWQTVPDAFVEDWSEKDREFVIWCLGEILNRGGMVAGAFQYGSLKGIAAVDNTPLGSRGQYRELSGFWVSQELRGKGMGSRLFEMAKDFARQQGAEKLYISSHSSVETQAFYKAMGCVEAEECSAVHVERGPFDCQIECKI